MILNLTETESSRLVLGQQFLTDQKYWKLHLISAGASFKDQRKPWLLQVYLEDATGKKTLETVLIPQGVDVYNFKMTYKTFHAIRTQNLDQVFITFEAKYGYRGIFDPLITYANLELIEYDGGFQEPKITRKILDKK